MVDYMNDPKNLDCTLSNQLFYKDIGSYRHSYLRLLFHCSPEAKFRYD
jgi:hypothetical protein